MDFDAWVESDPAVKLLEIAAYQELLLRTRIHEAIKANLLTTAKGEDLDHLAAFYDVERFEGESDEAFRTQILARIKA